MSEPVKPEIELVAMDSSAATADTVYMLKRDALGPHVVPTWGWDEAHQRAKLVLKVADNRYYRIVADGVDAGVVAVEVTTERVVIDDFYVAPALHRRGIGAAVLARILADADARSLPVLLGTQRWNPARALYQRHGFVVVTETTTRVTMRRPPAVIVREAESADDFAAFALLVSEYLQWCRDRYAAHPWLMDAVFSHQSLATELTNLSVAYSPPNGRTFVAVRDGEVVAGGAYRRLGDGTCEMKRLFVPPRHAGKGIGRRLCAAIIATARAEGFRLLRLDTGNLFAEAIALYASAGFRACPPYHDYPPEMMPFLVFMELPLDAPAPPFVATI